ncbi:hypothetical protein DUI87_31508 [Hirundo rustica rustica]|uniref:Uncharacterized protein n=1 Tax=Hirundo rustica rustica TaxID=333673 RepID=A0A3M0IZP2_HIRRU|nr:hypothetical protein DUI87_31508 [Hirundo rustica rustica]
MGAGTSAAAGVRIRAVPRPAQNEASENPELSDKTDFTPSEDSQSLSKAEPLDKILNGDVLNVLERDVGEKEKI